MNHPITVEDYMDFGEEFFAKYNYVRDRIPDASTEDILTVMETLGKLVVQGREDYYDQRRRTRR
tara:strand:+ start:253 stop:444 length:192 start_codon:yes stop_codon:yes gene_type:complete